MGWDWNRSCFYYILIDKVSSRLPKEDCQKFAPEAEQLIKKFGEIRVLF